MLTVRPSYCCFSSTVMVNFAWVGSALAVRANATVIALPAGPVSAALTTIATFRAGAAAGTMSRSPATCLSRVVTSFCTSGLSVADQAVASVATPLSSNVTADSGIDT